MPNTVAATHARRIMGGFDALPSSIQRLSLSLIGCIFYGIFIPEKLFSECSVLRFLSTLAADRLVIERIWGIGQRFHLINARSVLEKYWSSSFLQQQQQQFMDRAVGEVHKPAKNKPVQ